MPWWVPSLLRVPEQTGQVERMPMARPRRKALGHTFKEQMFVPLLSGPASGYRISYLD